MLNIRGVFRLFFPKLPPSNNEWDAWRLMRDKQLVQHYAKGSLRLQMGRYISGAELSLRKSTILAYGF